MKYNVKRHAVVQPQDDSIRLIPLTQGQNAIVDAADYGWLMQWNWCFIHEGTNDYAMRGDKELMHRVIMNFPYTNEVDHKNRNGLDNRRNNLRLATHAENSRNKPAYKTGISGAKGIQWCSRAQLWRVRVHANYKSIHVGYFRQLSDAKTAYNKAVVELHGEFAFLNH